MQTGTLEPRTRATEPAADVRRRRREPSLRAFVPVMLVAIVLASLTILVVQTNAAPIGVPAVGPEADAAGPTTITSTRPRPSSEGVSGSSTITSAVPRPGGNSVGPERITSSSPFLGSGTQRTD